VALASEVASLGPYQEVNVIMSQRTFLGIVVAILAIPAFISAQTYSPTVAMRVTTPDGQTQEVTARDSSVVSFTLKDGTAYELRPTVHDEPFSKVTVAIFKAGTASESNSFLGDVEVTKGAPAVTSKTKPIFKIAVTRIDAPGAKPGTGN
jgi:hypothetical protein